MLGFGLRYNGVPAFSSPKLSPGFLVPAKPHVFPECFPLDFTLQAILLIVFSDPFTLTQVY